MPVTPALRRLRQEECEFKASLEYVVRACPKNKQNKIKNHYLQDVFFKLGFQFEPSDRLSQLRSLLERAYSSSCRVSLFDSLQLFTLLESTSAFGQGHTLLRTATGQ
jgi:hypothetical protein